jgi:hypothetical protein
MHGSTDATSGGPRFLRPLLRRFPALKRAASEHPFVVDALLALALMALGVATIVVSGA